MFQFSGLAGGLTSEPKWPLQKKQARHHEVNFQFNHAQSSTYTNEAVAQHENALSRIVSGIDQDDAKRRYDLEAKDNQISLPNSSASSVSGSRKKVIHWEENDPENPYNWSPVRQCLV